MRTTIDRAGRVFIPRAMRERLGLQGGTEIEIRETEGRIEIEPAPARVRLTRRRRAAVAVPEESLPVLTDDVVRDTIDRTRR